MNSLVLVERSIDFEKLQSTISKFKNYKFISFDIFSHDKLNELNIEHEFVESYISKEDEQLIDKFMLDKSHEWYQLDSVSNLLQFENINLGWLLELEITPYFLRILKIFLGLIRIINKECPSKIVSSDLIISMVYTIDQKNTITTYSITTVNTASLAFDRVALPINIGKKLFTIWISRDKALKIKNFIEFLTNSIFHFKFNITKKSKQESILLLDFNPMFYSNFLKELSKLNKNILLLNERRPAIWNFKSLKSLINTKAKTIFLRDLHDEKTRSNILKKQKILQLNLEQLKENKELETFFSVEGYSFWPSIKKIFLSMCSTRFNEAIERNELIHKLFLNQKISSLVILFYPAPEEKIIINASQSFKIPGIILQHGLIPQSDYMKNWFKLFPYTPPKFIKHALWGNEIKNYFSSCGVKSYEMISSGSPRYDDHFKIKNSSENKGTILVSSSIISELAYYGINTNVFLDFKKILTNICKITNDIKNKKLIVKLHPGQPSSYDVRPLIHKINPSVPIYKTKDILELMKDCDVVICIGPSTIILEALILEKPIITYNIDPQWYYEDKIFQSGATKLVNTKQEFEDELDKILNDQNYRSELILKGKKFVNDYLVNQGTSSQKLAEYLNTLKP